MSNKLYKSLQESMSVGDCSQSFDGCVIYEPGTNQVYTVAEFDHESVVLRGSEDHIGVDREDFFSGRFELFPPHEGMAYVPHLSTCYLVTKEPARHWKKGMYQRHYSTVPVGDLTPRTGRGQAQFNMIALARFNPIEVSIGEAFDTISRRHGALSMAVGQWWAVGFSTLADGLALFYKTRPVAALISENEASPVTNDQALLGITRAQFPQLTWR